MLGYDKKKIKRVPIYSYNISARVVHPSMGTNNNWFGLGVWKHAFAFAYSGMGTGKENALEATSILRRRISHANVLSVNDDSHGVVVRLAPSTRRRHRAHRAQTRGTAVPRRPTWRCARRRIANARPPRREGATRRRALRACRRIHVAVLR